MRKVEKSRAVYMRSNKVNVITRVCNMAYGPH